MTTAPQDRQTREVLDLGRATGDLARALAAAGYRVTGGDISRAMLTRAAALGEGPSWVQLAPAWRTLLSVSAQAGLAPLPVAAEDRSALRLLAFRPEDSR